ncbi:MAG TPA: pyridoxamine 5'-phosphate oxidase family protein, partial [Mycobacterium sp.]|nr:pyridoxamine 5'-phosphate oxidase family protein [Mycobacterium sp.]
ASYPQRAKSANIRRNPKASVVVLSDEFNGAYVQIDGDAEVIVSAGMRGSPKRVASSVSGTSISVR